MARKPCTPPKPERLDAMLLKHAMFPSDCVIVYSDRTFSIGKLQSDKHVETIFRVDQLGGDADQVRDFLLYDLRTGLHAAGQMIKKMQAALIEKRGVDDAFHYTRSERNMLHASAQIAAREPEAAILFVKASHSGKKLRFIICPENNAESGIVNPVVSNVSPPVGWADYNNNIAIIAHPADRVSGLASLHEMVHLFESQEPGATDGIPSGMFERTVARMKWIRETEDAWNAHPESLTRKQHDFISEFKEKLRLTIAQRADYTLAYPDIDKAAHRFMKAVISEMEKLETLDPKYYKTQHDKVSEMIPLYEERVGWMGVSRLDPDDKGRELMEYAFPELGAYVREHYLPVLRKRHAEAVHSDMLATEKGELIVPLPALIFNNLAAPPGIAQQELNDADRAALRQLHTDLRIALTRTINFAPQAHAQMEEDKAFRSIRDFYSEKCGPERAQELAYADLNAIRGAIDNARNQLQR